jgi:TolC family type I secretion outer membrane protein
MADLAKSMGWSRSASFIVLAAATLASGARAEPLTLEQAFATAYETNPRLESERANLRATDEDVAKALSGWRPNLSVSGSYGYNQNNTSRPVFTLPEGYPRDVTVTATQPLFTGTTIPATRQAKSAVQAGRAQLTSVEQQILLSVARAYFTVAANEQQLDYRRQNVDLLTQNLNDTQQRVNIGDVTITDLQLVQSRLNSAMADVSFAEANLASARADFARAVGRPAEMLEMMPRLPQMPGSEQMALALALDNNPDLNFAREQARTADAAVDVAIGNLLPSLSLEGQYRRSRDEVATGVTDDAVSVMAQIRIPLYQGGGEYAEIRKAKENRSRATLLISDTERQVRQALDTAWQTQLAAQAAVVSHQQQVQAAQQAYEGFLQGIRIGERTTFDLLNAAQELVNARVSLADAQRQYYISTFELTVAMGGLTARALNLPVMFYDPDVHYREDSGKWFGFGN